MVNSYTESIKNEMVRVGVILTLKDNSYDLTVEDDIILIAPEHDATRLAMLLQRVSHQADILEQTYLPGMDQSLNTFEVELQKEGSQE